MTVYPNPGTEGSNVKYRERYDNYIGGDWVAPVDGEYFDNITPVTGEVFCQVARGKEADINLALDAAHKAAPAWGKTSPAERAMVLLKIADRMEGHLEELAVAETWENGKAVRETLAADIPLAIDHFRYYAGALRAQEGRLSQIDEDTVAYHFNEPLGVVGQIIPWNFPLLMAAWKLAPALAAGNAIVLKPAEQTPASILYLMDLVGDLIPAGVLNIVNGMGDEAGAALSGSDRIAKIAFTGSTEVGKIINKAAADKIIPVTLELGGKSPAIVDGSADIDEAAQRIAYGKLLNAGQTCIAPDYVLVPQASVQPFAMRLQGHMQHMFGTDPKNPDYSSIVSDRHYARLEALVADAAAKGATIMQPAAPNDPEWKERRKFPPTVIVDATPDMTVMQEEIFGPVLPVVGTRDAAEAIAFINKRDRPLALYWFGTDHAARDAVLARTVSGGVTVNDCLFHFAQAYQPMGGVGASGSGAYHGEWGFRTLTKLKPVFYRSRFNRLADLYPPYGAKVARLEKLMRLLS
mgnify:CR=1 FL=1